MVSSALLRLGRNMERNLINEPEEEKEKAALSVACVHFLKVASENFAIRAYMIEENAFQGLKKSLYFEEQYMTQESVPIDIENTYTGRTIEHLFRCMSGQDALSPKSIVSYRVIRRIADLLMGKDEEEEPEYKGDTAIEDLKQGVFDEFQAKLEKEVESWKNTSQEISRA